MARASSVGDRRRIYERRRRFRLCSRKGPRQVFLDQPHSLKSREGEFLWIGMLEPDAAELRTLQDHST